MLIILMLAVTVLAGVRPPALAFAESTPARVSSGLVIGMDGQVSVSAGNPHQTRALRVGDALTSGEEIRVGAGSTGELLWNKRALFSLQERTGLRLLEPIGGQMPVQVLEGHARLAYSYNEGRPSDTMAILLADARLIVRGGIVEVRILSSGEVIRVLEGQVSIELAALPGKPFLLKASQEVQITAGVPDVPHAFTAASRPRLVTMESHRVVPPSTVQRLAETHVEHALELEERLRRAIKDPHDDPSANESKGAILSTSLGLPVASFFGTSSTSLPGATASLNPGSMVLPPIQSPTVTAPPTPSVVTLGPVQAGGINTSALLQNTLKNILKK